MSTALRADSLRETKKTTHKNILQNKDFIPYMPIEKARKTGNRKSINRKSIRERNRERIFSRGG